MGLNARDSSSGSNRRGTGGCRSHRTRRQGYRCRIDCAGASRSIQTAADNVDADTPIATVVTPDNAYGGPIRVALNQLSELKSRGHTVTLAAGALGFTPGQLPEEYCGVPVRLFPVHRVVPRAGFAGLHAMGMNSWIKREAETFDVVHVHLARDMITLTAARRVLRARLPLFLQTHGMIAPSRHPLAGPLDGLITTRLLKSSQRGLLPH